MLQYDICAHIHPLAQFRASVLSLSAPYFASFSPKSVVRVVSDTPSTYYIVFVNLFRRQLDLLRVKAHLKGESVAILGNCGRGLAFQTCFQSRAHEHCSSYSRHKVGWLWQMKPLEFDINVVGAPTHYIIVADFSSYSRSGFDCWRRSSRLF